MFALPAHKRNRVGDRFCADTPGLRKAHHTPGTHLLCPTQGARLTTHIGQHQPVVAGKAQPQRETKPTPVHAESAFARCLVLGLGVNVYMVDIRVAQHHRGAIAVDQQIDARGRIQLPDGRDQRQGADQVADVIAADYQNFLVSVVQKHVELSNRLIEDCQL